MIQGCKINRCINIDSIYTFFKSDFKKDYVFGGEKHNFWEAVFVLDGAVGVGVDGNVFVLEKGSAIIHKPNEFHTIWSELGTSPLVMVLSFGASEFQMGGGRILSLDSACVNKLEMLYELSFKCFERKGMEIISVRENAQRLLEKFRLETELLLYSLTSKAPKEKIGVRSAEIYAQAVKFMEENPDGELSIEKISQHFSISGAYLKKIFSKYSGLGVMEYYNRIRTRLACVYLANGTSVKETANLLGFSDQNYFSTFFKRITGKSPTKYKAEITNKMISDV